MNHTALQPFIVKTMNRALSAIGTTRSARYLDAAELKQIASRKTGLDDLGNEHFGESFGESVKALGEAGNLNDFGRFALRNYMLGTLVKRLRIIDFLAASKEITMQEIDRPVFITGWYRTGTTYLHNLVNRQARGIRAPLLWELMNPCPELLFNNFRARSLYFQTWLKMRFQALISPGFQSSHPLRAGAPDECLHLMENAGLSSMTFFLSEATSVAWSQLQQDQVPAYRFYRQQLQLLDWQRPGKRWLLKWPLHLWHLDALFKVFPDARVVWLQRDPVEAVASVCRLAELARLPFCHATDRRALGDFWLQYCKAGEERARDAATDAVLEIRYPELVDQPGVVLEKISRHAELDISYEIAERENRVAPSAAYRLDDYGLSAERVKQFLQ